MIREYIPKMLVAGSCLGMGFWCMLHGDPQSLTCVYFALTYLVAAQK